MCAGRYYRQSREVMLPLGTKIQDITNTVPLFVKSTDYYTLLLFYLSMNGIAIQNLGRIREDYKDLGVQVKSAGARYLLLHFASWRKGHSQK